VFRKRTSFENLRGFGLSDNEEKIMMHISDVLYVFCVGRMIYLYHTECRGVGDAKICFGCSVSLV